MKSEFFLWQTKVLSVCWPFFCSITIRHLSDVQRRIVQKRFKVFFLRRFICHIILYEHSSFSPFSKIFLLDWEPNKRMHFQNNQMPDCTRNLRFQTKSVTLYIHLLEQNEITWIDQLNNYRHNIYVQSIPRRLSVAKLFQNAVRVPNANGKRVCRVYRVKISAASSIRRELRATFMRHVPFTFASFAGGGEGQIIPYVHARMHGVRGNFEFIPCARAVSTVD